MSRNVARIKGLGFLVWHGRHEFYHLLLGLIWAWYLRERWHEFNPRWIWFSVVGSLLPDADHLIYFVTYGRTETYTRQLRQFLREHEWRNLFLHIESGHKKNTKLASHNYYVMAILLGCSVFSYFYDWRVGVILFGAMLIHYVFDVADDYITLGSVNPNWKRWGREKELE
ncbi:hypothetical protein M1555_01755 [Patescibacteria group bacterium]|nr:hypothetical protein [Patescibacteria group bacterium]